MELSMVLIAEHAANIYFLLAFAAVMLVGVWWIQKQILYLAGAAAMLVVLLVFWLVIRNVPTTAATIEGDLAALGKALVAKDKATAEKYVVHEFKYKAKNPDKWYTYLEELISDYRIDAIGVKDFEVKTREGDKASVLFHIDARSKGTPIFAAECPWKLRREDDVWKVEKVTLRKAVLKADKDVSVDE